MAAGKLQERRLEAVAGRNLSLPAEHLFRTESEAALSAAVPGCSHVDGLSWLLY